LTARFVRPSHYTLYLLCLLVGCGSAEQTPPVEFPGIVLDHFDGSQRSIADYRGKIVVVNFWASWCAPCRREMPGLQRLAEQMAGEGFEVLGVSVDEDRFLAQEFLRHHGIRFDNYHDPGRQLAERQLAITAYPETLVVARNGVILARISGERNWDGPNMRALLKSLAEQTDK